MTFPPDATQTPGRHATPQQAQPGVIIAERYELTARVGDGGHGTVWRARDQLLQRDVAIKEIILPPNLPPEERQQLCDRTLREAQSAASLSHASVIRVFDVVTEAGLPWIVMELLQARSLADIISLDGPMPPRVAAKVGLALVGALEAAHSAGILHRDIKPGNVLISADGRCVLSDFGAAAAGAAGTGHTAPGMVLGSAHYIAPERAIGGPAVPASDLFSLGVTLYAATEGRPPFDRADTTATMHAVVHEPPEAPRRAGALAPVLAGLLEKDPARRFDVARTRTALSGLLAGSLGSDNATTALPTSGGPVSGIPGGSVSGIPGGSVSGAPVGPVSPPAPPTAAMPMQANPMPPGGDYPVPPQPTSAMNAYPPPPPYGGQSEMYGGRQSPVPPAKKPRNKNAILLTVGIAAVAIALVTTLGVMFFGGNGEGPPPDNAGDEAEADTEDKAEYEEYTDPKGNFSVEIPAGWDVQQNGETYVDVVDPENPDRWLRLNVPPGEGDPEAVLTGAEAGLNNSGKDFVKDSLNRIALESAELSGVAGKQLEYTGVRKRDDQERHAIWLIAHTEANNYHVYLSVPEDTYQDSLPIYENAVKTYKITA